MRTRSTIGLALLITAAIALPVVAAETPEPVSGPASATRVATPVTPVATDVVTVFNSGEMLPIVQQASINAARQAGAAIAFGRSAGVGMVGLYRGNTPVQLPAPGFAYSMGVTVLPPEVIGNTMGRNVSAVLAPDAVVMGQTSAGLRGAQAGDSMLLVSASGGGVWFRIAAVLADATIGGAELLMTPDASERLGITQTSRAVMWNPSSRAAMDQALAANGLVTTSIRIRRSWDPPDPDETLGLSRTKALLGEFTYRVNGDGSVTQEAAWQAANLPSGRRGLGLGISARCHLVIEPAISAALAEVAARGLGGTINVANTNSAGGCHNPRFNRLTPSSTLGFLSRHAWAAAIDMNTVGSCQGCAPPDFATLPGGCTTVQIFRKYGFAWGGSFIRPDGMHFEYVGERRDLLPYPSRWCQNTGAVALTTAEAGIGAFFATDGLARGRVMSTRFVILGGGPAGNTAATTAARLGAEVTMIERDVVGGAAHLWDCIPSKSMIATGRAISRTRAIPGMGLDSVDTEVNVSALTERIEWVKNTMRDNTTSLLASQGVRMLRGTGRFVSPTSVVVEGPDGAETIEFDAALVATGSRPRIPDWCEPDGERILTTRDCYPPQIFPESVTVIGSGVTGVEFVHMFSSFGAKVTLVVSRQQVLPGKDPEVAAVLEEEFMRRGVKLLMGARAESMERDDGGVTVRCDDGRSVRSTHAVLAIGSIPNTEGIGLEMAGVDVDAGGYLTINQHCVTNVEHIYAAGDISGKLPLSSVASMQGRKVAEHVMGGHTRSHRHLDYDKAASAIFTEPEIADVGLAEAEAFSSGRKIRVTKVPFSSTAKAMINNDTKGFVKIISDPATGEVLGGSIVGRQAAELISVIAVAVTAGLTVTDLAESILVHPALSEALSEAAE